jgi:hypothetical protein
MEENKNIDDLEAELSNNEEGDITPPADIVAFNELRSCADIFNV